MKVSLVLLLLGVFVLTAALPQGRPDEEETEQEEDTIGETAIEGDLMSVYLNSVLVLFHAL